MRRGRVAGAVRSLVASELNGRKFLFVLHVDGNLRVWDLLGRVKVLNFNVGLLQSSGNFCDPFMLIVIFYSFVLNFNDRFSIL